MVERLDSFSKYEWPKSWEERDPEMDIYKKGQVEKNMATARKIHNMEAKDSVLNWEWKEIENMERYFALADKFAEMAEKMPYIEEWPEKEEMRKELAEVQQQMELAEQDLFASEWEATEYYYISNGDESVNENAIVNADNENTQLDKDFQEMLDSISNWQQNEQTMSIYEWFKANLTEEQLASLSPMQQEKIHEAEKRAEENIQDLKKVEEEADRQIKEFKEQAERAKQKWDNNEAITLEWQANAVRIWTWIVIEQGREFAKKSFDKEIEKILKS